MSKSLTWYAEKETGEAKNKEASERERRTQRRKQLSHMVRKEMRKSQVERAASRSPAARGQTEKEAKMKGLTET